MTAGGSYSFEALALPLVTAKLRRVNPAWAQVRATVLITFQLTRRSIWKTMSPWKVSPG